MYKEHPDFKTPDDDKKIWRYMDFIKFFDIIDRKILFFPTADRLGDPFEGSFPKVYIDYFNANLDKIFIPETWKIINRKQAPKSFSRARRTERKFTAISCWNLQEEESAALWKLYCSTFNGIAIQSTIKRLKNSLKDERRDVYIGQVEYIDYYSHPLSVSPNPHIFPSTFLYKGKSFKFEKEVRAVTELPRLKMLDDFHGKFLPGHKGYDVMIDTNLLIEKVYLSPMGRIDSEWQMRIVKSVLKKYGLNKQVLLSDLKKKPIF
jgi:hypothetical protein